MKVMATNIQPESFRSLSLNLKDPIEDDFYDSSCNNSALYNPESDKESSDTSNRKNGGTLTRSLQGDSELMDRANFKMKKPTSLWKSQDSPSSPKTSNSIDTMSNKSRATCTDEPNKLTTYESDFSEVDMAKMKDNSNHPNKSTLTCPRDQQHTYSLDRHTTPLGSLSLHSQATSASSTARFGMTENDEEEGGGGEGEEEEEKVDDGRLPEPGSGSKLQSSRLDLAMLNLNRHLNVMRIRPPWRDPNSQLLPSDRNASIYDLYDEFTRSKQEEQDKHLNRTDRKELVVCRPYHTTLNRYRRQERIQMENYTLAKRLEQIRPTPGLTRSEQLHEYRRYFLPSNYYYAQRAPTFNRRPETAHSSSRVDHSGDHSVGTLKDFDCSISLSRPTRSAMGHRKTPLVRDKSHDSIFSVYDAYTRSSSTAKQRPMEEPTRKRPQSMRSTTASRKNKAPVVVAKQAIPSNEKSSLHVDVLLPRLFPTPPPPPSPRFNRSRTQKSAKSRKSQKSCH